MTVFYEGGEPLDPAFVASAAVCGPDASPKRRAVAEAVRAGDFDYVVLFESSGMYRGEDVVALASHLAVGRLDAVWGSRRLSVRDIQESYRLRYRIATCSSAQSATSAATCSVWPTCSCTAATFPTRCRPCARCAPTDALEIGHRLTHKRANQFLLARLLRRKAEILEIPVQFFPISPEKVKRTSPFEGLQSLATIVAHRFAAGASAPERASDAGKRDGARTAAVSKS